MVVMPKILVADQIAEAGLERMRACPGVTFDVRHGLSPKELSEAVGQYEGMLIRSAVKVTSETLAKPGKLEVIARAGVGVDNVDLDAATAAGVLVLNTPDANTISTAEHTMAVMLALHRQVPQAHAHVASGQWKRGAFNGEELSGRTLGIVGFGRIGRAVAQRALAFEMKVVAFDPFVAGETTMNGAVRLVPDLMTLLSQCDCVTLHASLSDNTKHLISHPQLARMKKGAKLINCARGALIDEPALADALNSGQLSGAAVDVYENEPPVGSPLLTAKNMVLTPHLAASTSEAQLRVSIDAVDAVLAYLQRGEIRSAVNVAGLPTKVAPHHRPFLDLCSRMGAVLSTWCQEGVECVRVTVQGDSLQEIAPSLPWQALVAMLTPHLDARVNLVNAKEQAKKRGIVVEHASQTPRSNWPDTVVVSVRSRGREHEIEGTVFGDGRPRILSIDDYRMELVPENTIALIFNDDRPGVIGLVGQTFGNAGINIADMTLSRRGQTALMVLKLDAPMPGQLRDTLAAMNPPIQSVRTVTLPPLSNSTS